MTSLRFHSTSHISFSFVERNLFAFRLTHENLLDARRLGMKPNLEPHRTFLSRERKLKTDPTLPKASIKRDWSEKHPQATFPAPPFCMSLSKT